jgi:hypothetical protein
MEPTRTNTTIEEIKSISENMSRLELQEWIHRVTNDSLSMQIIGKQVIDQQDKTIKLLETKVDILKKTVEKVHNSNQGTVKKRDEMIEAKQILELENRELKEENEMLKKLNKINDK